MTEWCMAHPWMTFWIVITALIVIGNIVENLCRIVNNCLRVSLSKNVIEMSDVEGESDQ